ncbi:MAG: Beta-barrel assembly-enhancing protease [Chlamydiae bacterium]|nr:Beta-barrel assembly-enhancing protease [Chlamydiota bacterium]
MKKLLLLLIFAAIIGLGIGLFYYWPEIDQELSKFYSGPTEEVYFEEDVEETNVPPEGDEEETFEFEEETSENLVALAAEVIHEDPKQSWIYLQQALEKDPSNTNIHIYRARILESAGKPSLAQEEYELAFAEKSESAPYTDQYAGFLIRRGEYNEAQNLLNDHLKPPSSDSIWLKALFLNKVYQPIPFQWSYHRIPKGHAKPLIHYVLQLPKGQFWNGTEYEKVNYGQDYLENQQITFWLQLLEALNHDKNLFAQRLIDESPFQSESWNPQLEINIARILNYKLNRTLTIDRRAPVFNRFNKSAQKMTPLTYVLEGLAENEENTSNTTLPNDARALLLSSEIFTVALLDAKWNEAALQLHKVKRYPSSFPKNLAHHFALILRKHRGDQAALEFAENQEPTPQLDLLIAELRLETSDKNLAMNQLHHLSQQPGDIGLHASQLLAEAYIEMQEYQKAKEFIERTPHLAQDTSGQELMAQIFLDQDQPELASRIYAGIVDQSQVAKEYLAQKAIDERDWERARELSEQLAAEFPENKEYQRNLKYALFKLQ